MEEDDIGGEEVSVECFNNPIPVSEVLHPPRRGADFILRGW